jgi:hypothetical protein
VSSLVGRTDSVLVNRAVRRISGRKERPKEELHDVYY